MNVDIITPEKKLYSGTVKSVYVPGVNGEFQMLDNHAPIVSILKAGKIKLEAPEAETSNLEQGEKGLYEITVEGGVIEMNHGKIIILAE
ncbi:ATP synthase epsilon chain [Flavobacteriaceae bacterium UJ101]|nr:ATP synthase epsilon chain [Flavobacteriaceae bacterium UJ101]